MSRRASLAQDQSRLTKRIAAVVFGALLAAGAVKSQSMPLFVSYVLVILAAALPGLLWIRQGAAGIPILATVAFAYIPYFAWPLLNAQYGGVPYDLTELSQAAYTVAFFLAAAAVAWQTLIRDARGKGLLNAAPSRTEGVVIVRFVLFALVLGFAFNIALLAGWLSWLGFFYGLARSIVMTVLMTAFFMMGVARGQGILRGYAWNLAVISAISIVVVVLSSLFLVLAMLYLLSAILGYFLVRRRIPWLFVAGALLIFSVLHAGKGEMRGKYWVYQANYSEDLTVLDIPELMVEWGVVGVGTLTSPQRRESVQNLAERMSLLRLLLLAQRATPYFIDYLRGETYAMLPPMLVPRFLNPDKPVSQAAITLLNVRFGVQTAEAAAVTAIGWGVVAEAWVNFGYAGVIGIGVLLGAFCALLENWSAHSAVLSIPMLVGISSMMALINLEADFCNLVMALIQSAISVVIFSVLYRKVVTRRLRMTR